MLIISSYDMTRLGKLTKQHNTTQQTQHKTRQHNALNRAMPAVQLLY